MAGSRGFNDYALLDKELRIMLKGKLPKEVEIVSGTARGADSMGEKFAKSTGCNIRRMPAEWDKYGRSAGYIRNAEMADYADACIVFWDGVSPGTKHMIDLAEKKDIECKVITY